ncbi:MAG: PQQ-binding-like beta-propeller repeat protein, partial [Planctomycetaceae bacterium]
PVDGRELWQCRFEGHSLVPRPVTTERFLLVCTGYHQASLLAFRWDDVAQGGAVTPAWKIASGVPFVSSPIVVDDWLLFVSDDGILSCVSAETGKPAWKQRLGGQFSASPIALGRRVYLADEEGTTYVFEAGPRYRELARNSLPGKVLASPAVYDNRLYVRTETHLYCLADAGLAGDAVRLTGGERPAQPPRPANRTAH